MKKVLLIVFSLFSMIAVSAQSSGIVHYDEKVRFNIQMEDNDAKMMDALPKEHTSKKQLFFTPDASLYQNEKGESQESKIENESADGNRMIIQMDEPDDKAYCDFKNNKLVQQRDFMSRKFLIETDLNKMIWKLSGKQKKILNYPCQEAILQDTTKKLTVWFTALIPVSTGPAGYSNLPGLILEADFDNGERIISATKIDFSPFDSKQIIKPKDGKKISKEEFNKIVMEKRKEMEDQNGGNGNVIIKIRH